MDRPLLTSDRRYVFDASPARVWAAIEQTGKPATMHIGLRANAGFNFAISASLTVPSMVIA